jgi:hypothetical protein
VRVTLSRAIVVGATNLPTLSVKSSNAGFPDDVRTLKPSPPLPKKRPLTRAWAGGGNRRGAVEAPSERRLAGSHARRQAGSSQGGKQLSAFDLRGKAHRRRQTDETENLREDASGRSAARLDGAAFSVIWC